MDDIKYTDKVKLSSAYGEMTKDKVDAIPIDWIKSYVLSTGKPLLPFMAMINEWRRING